MFLYLLDATTFEVKMRNYSHDIEKTVPATSEDTICLFIYNLFIVGSKTHLHNYKIYNKK